MQEIYVRTAYNLDTDGIEVGYEINDGEKIWRVCDTSTVEYTETESEAMQLASDTLEMWYEESVQ